MRGSMTRGLEPPHGAAERWAGRRSLPRGRSRLFATRTMKGSNPATLRRGDLVSETRSDQVACPAVRDLYPTLGGRVRRPGDANALLTGERLRHGLCRGGVRSPAAPRARGTLRPPLLDAADGGIP